MKKLLALLVIPGVLVFFVGCGATTTPPASSPSTGGTGKPDTTGGTGKPKEETKHEGTYVDHKGDKLTIKDEKGKEHEFDTKGVKEAPKWDELKKGETKLKVMAKEKEATKIEVVKADAPPPVVKEEGKTVEGKFVAVKDGVLTVKVGDKDQEFKDIKDVKDFKADDYKKDDSIKVTTDKDGKVTKIEKGK